MHIYIYIYKYIKRGLAPRSRAHAREARCADARYTPAEHALNRYHLPDARINFERPELNINIARWHEHAVYMFYLYIIYVCIYIYKADARQPPAEHALDDDHLRGKQQVTSTSRYTPPCSGLGTPPNTESIICFKCKEASSPACALTLPHS